MATKSKTNADSSTNSHSVSEATHAKNVANYLSLISIVQSFGANYNPVNAALKVTSLQTQQSNADTAVSTTKNLYNTLQQTINARADIAIGMKPLSTRLVNALEVAGADKETMLNARTINRKIQGGRAKKLPEQATPEATPANPQNTTDTTTENKSVSQQSFDSTLSNLTALVNYASQLSLYNPNEADLKISALNTFLTQLKTANSLVKTAEANYQLQKIVRTSVLYDPTTGLVQTALEVKKYVKSIYGATAPQTKQVTHIHFKTLIKRARKKHNKKK